MNSQERIAVVSDHLRRIRRASSELVNTLIMKYPELDNDNVNKFFTSKVHLLNLAIKDLESLVTRWNETEKDEQKNP
jgi:hypothetical protein